MKSFCSECGSAAPNLQMDGQLLVVPAGSLNNEPHVNPTAHIFYSSRAGWEDLMPKATKFEKLP